MSAKPGLEPATFDAATWLKYQLIPNIAMLTAISSAVTVPGIGMTPRILLLSPSPVPRRRAGRAAAPHMGQTLAPRSMSARQEGHILKAEAGLLSREPNMIALTIETVPI